MLVTHVARRHFGKSYSMMPLALSAVWDALDDAWDNLANLETLAAFRELIGSTMIPAPPPPEEVRGAWQDLQQESSGRLFAGHAGDTLEALKGEFPEFVRRLGKGGETHPLELPVSGNVQDACADAAFWLEAINHQFFWKRFEPSLFVEGAAQKKNRQVLMVFGIIRPQDYAPILGCGEGGARVTRPARAVVPPDAGQEPDRPPEEGPTFAELLKGITGH